MSSCCAGVKLRIRGRIVNNAEKISDLYIFQEVSGCWQERDQLLHGVLQEGEGDVRLRVHDLRHVS